MPSLALPNLSATLSTVSWLEKKFWLADLSKSVSLSTAPSEKSTSLASVGVSLSILTTAEFAGVLEVCILELLTQVKELSATLSI